MRFVVEVFSEDISNAQSLKKKKYVWGHEKEATINIAEAHLFTLIPSTLRKVKHPIHKSYQENDFKLLFTVIQASTVSKQAPNTVCAAIGL